MSFIRACAAAAVVCGAAAAAVGSPTEAITATNTPCDALFPQAFYLHQGAPRTTRYVRVKGTLAKDSVQTSQWAVPREQLVAIDPPGGIGPMTVVAGSNAAAWPAGGTVAVDAFVKLPAPVTTGAGDWRITLTSLRDTSELAEAYWSTLTVPLSGPDTAAMLFVATSRMNAECTPKPPARVRGMGCPGTTAPRFAMAGAVNAGTPTGNAGGVNVVLKERAGAVPPVWLKA